MSPSSSRGRRGSLFEPMGKEEVVALLHSRFGIPGDAFEGCRFYRKAKSIWVISDEDLPNLSYEALGLRMISLKDRPWKPTTCALQIFGKYATKNVVYLNDCQAKAFLAGESQPLEAECEPGYVVVFYRGDVLGCGLYSRGALASQLPKERRIASSIEGANSAEGEGEDNR